MRLAISNIGWEISEDEVIAQLLIQYGIDAVDIAPGKYFPSPTNASVKQIKHLRDWWQNRGIELTGMQALLFGMSELNIFGPQKMQEAILKHLDAVCRIASGLEAVRLVFGSPKNRDRSGLTDQEALEIAVPFFRRLGDIAHFHGVLICLEPNPRCYGANFMTTSTETAQVVKQIAHPAIKMQLDTGVLTINSEEATSTLNNYAHLIGHVHASEPNLLPLGEGGTEHTKVYQALIQHLPTHLVCIEMVATKNEPHPVSIERALKVAIGSYRPHAPAMAS